jgi:hypothetical protein
MGARNEKSKSALARDRYLAAAQLFASGASSPGQQASVKPPQRPERCRGPEWSDAPRCACSLIIRPMQRGGSSRPMSSLDFGLVLALARARATWAFTFFAAGRCQARPTSLPLLYHHCFTHHLIQLPCPFDFPFDCNITLQLARRQIASLFSIVGTRRASSGLAACLTSHRGSVRTSNRFVSFAPRHPLPPFSRLDLFTCNLFHSRSFARDWSPLHPSRRLCDCSPFPSHDHGLVSRIQLRTHPTTRPLQAVYRPT